LAILDALWQNSANHSEYFEFRVVDDGRLSAGLGRSLASGEVAHSATAVSVRFSDQGCVAENSNNGHLIFLSRFDSWRGGLATR